MKLSVSAYRAHASAHKKILSSGYHSQLNYGSTGAAASASSSSFSCLYEPSQCMEGDESENILSKKMKHTDQSNTETVIISPTGTNSCSTQDRTFNSQRSQNDDNDDNSQSISSNTKSPSQRKSYIDDRNSIADSDWTKSNQRWMKLRTTVQISSAIQKKPPLKREDSFLKRFSTRQVSETQETIEDTGSESGSGDAEKCTNRRRRYLQKRKSVVNPDENFYFYWLMLLTICVLYNLWALIVRQSFPELQNAVPTFWCVCDVITDAVFIIDLVVQLRTGYLEQGLMVYDDKKLACHYVHSRDFFFDIMALIPLDLLQLKMGTQPLLRFTRFFKAYRSVRFYYIVESRTVWPNLWRVINLIHILLILAHWFGCFYYLLSEAEGFQGDWVYPYRPGDYATLTRKYLGSLYWSTLTLTTIGDLPTPETNAEPNFSVDGPRSIPRRGIKSRLLQFGSSYGYIFTIVSYLIGVFIFATIVGQVGNVITNRNANRLEFERLLDGAKTYMRHHKVPGGMKRRVLRWYDYSWSRGRIQGGGDINTALGLLPDKLKTELALHVNLSVLKKVTIFQECQPEFLHDLVLKMKAYIFTPGDSICRKGEVAREMFIIADGILEVLSETGKVLTTMKAGDFFGEIGILNLDGLNKRTADVRSVGYSELFSLSREDVLAAMKDYPEAQEILQTLGRKRLMEVRCVNKKYAKTPSNDKDTNISQQNAMPVTQSTESRMVEKFKNDVKVFRNVLKITRAQRKSEDYQDVQSQNLSPPKDVKAVLKRISRVRSEDKEEKSSEGIDKDEQQDKTPSPIGAGLPLLQRLRLLREKQDREERAVKSTPPTLKSPTHSHSHVTCTLSPQESIKEEPERETNEVTALKANIVQTANDENTKTMPLSDANSSKIAVAKVIKMPEKSHWRKLGGNHNNKNQNNRTIQTAKEATSSCSLIKESTLEENAAKIMQTEAILIDLGSKPNPVIKQHIKMPSTSSNDMISASKMPKLIASTSSETDNPWSRLKLATLFSSSYTNLPCNSSHREDMPLKNYSLGNIPQTIAEEGSSSSKEVSQINMSIYRPHESPLAGIKKDRLSAKRGNSVGRKVKKFYRSVFDLSPEYKGLPFVKRLKILNDRQRLDELEKAVQSRSNSLDSPKTSTELPLASNLYRCYSDTSCIYSRLLTRNDSYSTITSTNTSISECTQLRCSNASVQLDHLTPAYISLPSDSKELLDKQEKLCIQTSLKPSIESEIKVPQDNVHLPQPSLIIGNSEQVQDQQASAFTSSFQSHSNNRKTSIDEKTSLTGPAVNNYNSLTIHPQTTDTASPNYNVPPTKTADPMTTHINSKFGEIREINQISTFQGMPEAQEYFNQILFGINSVVKTHMNEMQLHFKSQFSTMANEIRNRDKIITELQTKLKRFETKNTSRTYASRKEYRERLSKHVNTDKIKSKDEFSSDSSAELLFMRGDTNCTFVNSPPLNLRDQRNNFFSPSTSKNGAELASNYANFGESIILDIGDSSSTSSTPSSGKRHTSIRKRRTYVDRKLSKSMEDKEDKRVAHVHHNDWEVRMLAAEMEKQERKRGFSLTESITEFAELECTDTEVDDVFSVVTRPRASSLDQFNLKRGAASSNLPATNFNFKRDREKL